MSRRGASYEPAVTATALALHNLKHLPYARLCLASTPTPDSPIARRAQWLEHGIGSHTSFHAAALAELSEKLPAVLAVSTPSPPPSKPPRHPTSSTTSSSSTTNSSSSSSAAAAAATAAQPPAHLWLFAPTHALALAIDLLATDFTTVDRGAWAIAPNSTNVANAAVTKALTAALKRTIVLAMQTEQCVRVGDAIAHPKLHLLYHLDVRVTHGCSDPAILIHVDAHHFPMRPVDDDDTTGLPVFTCPLGLRGVLSPRPAAGDALAASVRSRWKEVGLLPPYLEARDTTVVFIRLASGAEVPFPRACVFTTSKKHVAHTQRQKPSLDDLQITDVTAKKPGKLHVPLWKSKKRPRSPRAVTSDDEDEHQPQDDLGVVKPAVPNQLAEHAQNIPDLHGVNSIIQSTVNNIQQQHDLQARHHHMHELQHQQQGVPSKPYGSSGDNNNMLPNPNVTNIQSTIDNDDTGVDSDIPTAQTLNAVLRQADERGLKDPIPKLNHPLIQPVPRLLFHDTADLDSSNNTLVKPENNTQHKSNHANSVTLNDKLNGNPSNGVNNNNNMNMNNAANNTFMGQMPPKLTGVENINNNIRNPSLSNDRQNAGLSSARFETLQSPGILGSGSNSNMKSEFGNDQSSNGLDEFLLTTHGGQHQSGPLSSSCGMDMPDFETSPFEENVTSLFPTNMDDGLNDDNLLQQANTNNNNMNNADIDRNDVDQRNASAVNAGFLNTNQPNNYTSNSIINSNGSGNTMKRESFVQQNNMSKMVSETTMDVDSNIQHNDLLQRRQGNDSQSQQRILSAKLEPQESRQQNHQSNQQQQVKLRPTEQSNTTITIIDSTLAALRRSPPTSRPSTDIVSAKLSTFLEDDVQQRRIAGLKASRVINKRKHPQLHRRPRHQAILPRPQDNVPKASHHIYITKRALSSMAGRRSQAALVLPNNDQRFSNELRGLYIPRRPMRKYISLRRKGAPDCELSATFSRKFQPYDSSESEGEEDEEDNFSNTDRALNGQSQQQRLPQKYQQQQQKEKKKQQHVQNQQLQHQRQRLQHLKRDETVGDKSDKLLSCNSTNIRNLQNGGGVIVHKQNIMNRDNNRNVGKLQNTISPSDSNNSSKTGNSINEYDPNKIVDSVAVDCASACLVLAAERASFNPCSISCTDSSGCASAAGDSNSPTGRDFDINSKPGVMPTVSSQSGGTSGMNIGNINNNNNPSNNNSSNRNGIANVLPKVPVPANLTSSSVSANRKKERELLSLLSLIEMQIFSVPDLCLFNSDINQQPGKYPPNGNINNDSSRLSEVKFNLVGERDILLNQNNQVQQHAQQQQQQEQSNQNESVPAATMRRLLLGLTRTLEMSDTFKTWIDAFREPDKNSPIPCIQGPLSISAFFGQPALVFPLPPPRVCVGYEKDWMETTSDALPLWEKLGMGPQSEAKNIEYVAIAPKEIEEDVRLFLKDLSCTYEECSFGRHTEVPDPITFIANSMARSNNNYNNSSINVQQSSALSINRNNGSVLQDSEKAMVEQYQLARIALHNKLTAIVRDKRKHPSGSPTNIVAYIVSPFSKSRNAANAALLHAVAPLVGTVQGTVPALPGGHTNFALNLPSAPWRASPSVKSTVSITVRMIPREAVDRQLTGSVNVAQLLDRPLRPQLMKAFSFAVFSSIRYKRVRTPTIDVEMGNALARGSLIPEDLMSPMTPELLGDGSCGPCGTPVSPIGVVATDDSSVASYGVPVLPQNSAASTAGGSNSSSGTGAVDQSLALSTSYLHEGAVTLAGVGRHVGQTGEKANMVIHLGYTYCEALTRFVFAWTDQRGEILDSSSVPVSKVAISGSRRKAFWAMWARGQRWRLPYVEDVHATVCKLGAMGRDELADWDWVMNKVVCSSYGGSERKNADGSERRVARRFPPIQGAKGDDIDLYSDMPTPATPGIGQTTAMSSSGRGSGSSNGSGGSGLSMDAKLPGIGSVSLLNMYDGGTDVLMEKAVDYDALDRRDFGMVCEMSLNRNQHLLKAQVYMMMGRFLEDGSIKAMEIGLLRHYGCVGEGADMSDERCGWDSSEIRTIANTIGCNFHELRYVASAPCWPATKWLSMLPVHLETVKIIDKHLRVVSGITSDLPLTPGISGR